MFSYYSYYFRQRNQVECGRSRYPWTFHKETLETVLTRYPNSRKQVDTCSMLHSHAIAEVRLLKSPIRARYSTAEKKSVKESAIIVDVKTKSCVTAVPEVYPDIDLELHIISFIRSFLLYISIIHNNSYKYIIVFELLNHLLHR